MWLCASFCGRAAACKAEHVITLCHDRYVCCLQVSVRLYDGETHTSPLIENPMRGGTDELTDDILALVTQQPGLKTRQFPLCPAFLISLAAIVCPF